MHIVLIYTFPVVLVLFEWGLRNAISVDTSGFTGPALAAAALSFLMPLTKPKEASDTGFRGRDVLITSRMDSHFVAFTWLLILAFLFAWGVACYLSIRTPDSKLLGFPSHLTIGSGLYFVSLVMTAFKEKT
jgi:hypothetical protein